MADWSYIGVGKVFMKEVGASAGHRFIGNVSALNFSGQEDVKELRDFTQAGGGTYNEVRRVTGMEIGMTLHDLSPENLALVLFGSKSAVVGGTVSNYEATAYKGTLIPLAHPNPTSVTVTNDGGVTTYVDGTDYEVTPAGIMILDTFTGADASVVEIDYTYAGYNAVQALTTSAKEYELVFEGLNEARSGKSVIVKAWRVKFGIGNELPLIGEDYAAVELTGKALKDSSKTGGTSQYFQALLAN